MRLRPIPIEAWEIQKILNLGSPCDFRFSSRLNPIIRQQGFLVGNPLISEFLAAGITQPGFTAKADCFGVSALVIAACEAGITHDNPTAGQHLADRINHSLADGISVAQVIAPP